MTARTIDLSGLMEAQRQIVTTLDRRVFVAAGAGSGKTFTLTRRIVWALCPGSASDGGAYLSGLDQALIITFTEKAAGEIRERVRSALREAGFVDESLRVDEAWIGTIHGMCSRILHRHALDLGLDPEFSVIVDHRAQEMRAQALEAAISEAKGTPGLAALQEAFPLKGTDGGGDFRSMASMLIDKASSTPGGFGALRFVSAETDVSQLMQSLLVSYEALCGHTIKNEAELEACIDARDELRAFATLAPGARTAEAACELMARIHRPNGTYWRAGAVKEAYAETRAMHAWCEATLALAGARRLERPLLALARRADELFCEAKRAAGCVDNDDLLRLTFEAFRDHPELAERYAHKFRLVMIDEFQDTSSQQVEMARMLSGEDACHLCTVGDAQQSIYRFRGADVDVFRRYEAQSGDDVVRLVRNFRSHDDVLRLVARVCGDGGLISGFMDLEANPAREDGYKAAGEPRVYLEFVRGIKASGKGTKAPGAAQRRRAEAALLADRFARLHEQGTPLGDMALLLGAMSQADVYLEALRARGIECVVAGGSTFARSPEAQAVLALLHVLANPKDTKTGLFPLLASDMFCLDANDFCMLGTKQQEANGAPAKRRIYPGVTEPLFEGLDGSERLAHARDVLARAWQRAATLPVADVCLMALRESGWLERLETKGAEGQASVANLLAAVRYVRNLTEDAGFGPARAAAEFDAWLASAKVGPAALSGAGLAAVSVMTIHKSKGLEFPVVAVAECYGGQRSVTTPRLLAWEGAEGVTLSLAPPEYAFDAKLLGDDVPLGPEDCATPLEWRVWLEMREREAAEQELGRLVYVGLTRAREALIICAQGEPTKAGALSKTSSGVLTESVVSSLIDPACAAGTHSFAYGGSMPGVARVVDLRLGASGGLVVDAAGAIDEAVLAARLVPEPSSEGEPSEPFVVAESEEPLRGLASWRPREGVFSYSSAHARLGAGTLALDDVLELPRPASASTQEQARAHEVLAAGEALGGAAGRGARACGDTAPAAALVADADERAGEGVLPADADRATSLGSAFHELARFMVETSQVPGEERLGLVATAWGVERRDLGRLREALARWERSQLRHEVLAHRFVRAEVPFFCAVESPLGSDLEGAIDLLASDALPHPGGVQDGPAAPAALLVDYKTGDAGLTYAQIRRRHEMQARFYAFVLKRMGYGEITCAFVCVELEGEAGEPVVVRYQFA